jgi:hypothetical protein
MTKYIRTINNHIYLSQHGVIINHQEISTEAFGKAHNFIKYPIADTVKLCECCPCRNKRFWNKVPRNFWDYPDDVIFPPCLSEKEFIPNINAVRNIIKINNNEISKGIKLTIHKLEKVIDFEEEFIKLIEQNFIY